MRSRFAQEAVEEVAKKEGERVTEDEEVLIIDEACRGLRLDVGGIEEGENRDGAGDEGGEEPGECDLVHDRTPGHNQRLTSSQRISYPDESADADEHHVIDGRGAAEDVRRDPHIADGVIQGPVSWCRDFACLWAPA